MSAQISRLPTAGERAATAPAPTLAPAPEVIRFDGVSKAYRGRGIETTALDAVSLTVRRGEFVSLVGPSGSGKTTLLNMAAGLLAPDSGAVRYRGAALAGPNTDVGYMTQDDALLPWRSVLGNVALPLEIRGVPKAERLATAQHTLEMVGLGGFPRHFPAQLSGGMRKRVALARTLVYRPQTVLLDEPFSALDAQTRVAIQKQLKTLARELDLTVLLVTHDLNEAIALSDRIVVFSARPARVLDTIALPPRAVQDLARRTPADEAVFSRIWDQLAEPAESAEASEASERAGA